MSTSKDKPQPKGGGGQGTGSTGGGGQPGGSNQPGGGAGPGGGGHQPGGGTHPGGGHTGGGTGGTGTGSTGGSGGTGPGGHTGGPGHNVPGGGQTGDDKRRLPKVVEFTHVTIKDDSDVGEGELYFRFDVTGFPSQFSGRLNVSDDEKAPVRPLKSLKPFQLEGRQKEDDRKKVVLTVEGREDDTPGYADPFNHRETSTFDHLGTATVTINEGDPWKPGENEVTANTGKFRVRYTLR